VAQGAFGSTGTLHRDERVILHKKIADKFIEKLIERVKKIKVGDGSEEGVTMGRRWTRRSTKLIALYRDCEEEGCKALSGRRSDGWQARERLLRRADGVRRREAGNDIGAGRGVRAVLPDARK